MRTPFTLSSVSCLTKGALLSVMQICQATCLPSTKRFLGERGINYYLLKYLNSAVCFLSYHTTNCTAAYNPNTQAYLFFFNLSVPLFLEFMMSFKNMICPSHGPKDRICLSPVSTALWSLQKAAQYQEIQAPMGFLPKPATGHQLVFC